MDEKFPLIRIDWLDASMLGGWEPTISRMRQRALDGKLLVRSVGWLIYSDDKRLILCPHTSGEAVADCMEIPKVCIVEQRELDGEQM